MTQNQLAYWRDLEAKRHNRKTEQEEERSNKAREAENFRHNQADEEERHRANTMLEGYEGLKIAETGRHDQEWEKIERDKAGAMWARSLVPLILPFLPGGGSNSGKGKPNSTNQDIPPTKKEHIPKFPGEYPVDDDYKDIFGSRSSQRSIIPRNPFLPVVGPIPVIASITSKRGKSK